MSNCIRCGDETDNRYLTSGLCGACAPAASLADDNKTRNHVPYIQPSIEESVFASIADMGSSQKHIGIVLVAVGLIWLAFAWSMDTSVSTEPSFIGDTFIPGRSVVNLDKQDRRRNHLLLASLMTLSGVILLGVTARNGTARLESTPFQEKGSSTDAPPCARDLSLDAYKIWLVSKYLITKNDVLGGYVCNNSLFPTTEEALSHAHSLELAAVAATEAAAQEAARRREW